MASSENQVQDSGGKAIHKASNTSSRIISKSLSSHGGRASYRGVVYVAQQAQNCKSFVQCDALILDNSSRADAYPVIDVCSHSSSVAHEASVSKMSDDQIFYAMSRGLPEVRARTMIVNGFIDPFVKELPVEFAVEMNRLIDLEMERSNG
jgi:Fe-S cluster assembly protein SufB